MTPPQEESSLEQFLEQKSVTHDITVRAEDNLKFFRDELTLLGYKVAFELVPVDFILWVGETPITAERKTGADFLRSIAKRAIFEQAKAMLEITPRSFLILENSTPKQSFDVITKYYSSVSEASIMGVQQWLGEAGVHVISSSGPKMTLSWLVTRLREAKEGGKPKPVPLRPSASRSLSSAEQAAYVAAGFPELGVSHLNEVRSLTESLLEFVEWLQEGREIDFPTTRIKNLRERWRTILTTPWHNQ